MVLHVENVACTIISMCVSITETIADKSKVSGIVGLACEIMRLRD